MRWTAPPKPWRSSTSRRTSPPTSRKSSTRSTTPHGTASSEGTLAATSLTKRNTSSTSTWDRLLSCCTSLDESCQFSAISPRQPGSRQVQLWPGQAERGYRTGDRRRKDRYGSKRGAGVS